MEFPYGTAALAIGLIALITGAGLTASSTGDSAKRPDLIYATFTKEHAAAYEEPIAEFEKENGVHVQLQVVDQKALQSRLESSLEVGADVPDMVEILDGTLGYFTMGPIEDVGFVDLTDKVKSTGLYEKLVQSRFGKWSSRGRIFALPHDVHPVMLCYRRDLVEQLGIDVNKLTTWDEFCKVGRQITRRNNRDDDRYMIDLPVSEAWGYQLMMLQKGGGLFNQAGDARFDSDIGVDLACWYCRQTGGKNRISFPCGWGQNLAKSMIDGLCLFYLCPDWRTAQFQMDVASLSGKLALMPLPAWTPGGLRTSTWGGTGLAITKHCKNPELAWKLAMRLYYDPQQLGERYSHTNILPPYKPAWSEPQFDAPRPFYSNIHLGRAYADLAPLTPLEYSSPYTQLASNKQWEAYTNIAQFFKDNGEDNITEQSLREYATKELHRCADDVRRVMKKNVFLKESEVVQ